MTKSDVKLLPECYELHIQAPDEKKDLLTALLIELGEQNFVEGALDCESAIEFDYDHSQKDYYSEFGDNLPFIVYNEDKNYLESLMQKIIHFAPQYSLAMDKKDFKISAIKDQNWRESWKASFKPVDIEGKCIIIPPWENRDSFSQPYKIVIDPGMAFGTGQHETTKLCLKLYYELTQNGSKFPRVFDVGTGSGILAIGTSMHGAEFVLGCDIDAPSIDIARENAVKNNTPSIQFTTTPIANIHEKNFDLIFANIQLRPLLKIFPEILDRSKKGGVILISGILGEEATEFCQFLKNSGAHVTKVEHLHDWVGIVCQKI